MAISKFRKLLRAIGVAGGVAALLAIAMTGTAIAIRQIAGNLILDIGVGFAPRALPHTHDAPLRFWIHEALGTQDGSIPPPITHMKFEVDKNGHVETRGLPTCSKQKLIATTTAQARRACPGAIVGSGMVFGVIAFPEQAPIKASAPITFFNAPRVEGDPTVIAHAHLDVPAPTTYLVSAQIERIHKGPLGYRVEADVPKVAGGYGSATYFRFRFGREWRTEGGKLSFLNARCAIPNRPHLLGRTETRFADGTDIDSILLAHCQVR